MRYHDYQIHSQAELVLPATYASSALFCHNLLQRHYNVIVWREERREEERRMGLRCKPIGFVMTVGIYPG
jgi:hypothetical protein